MLTQKGVTYTWTADCGNAFNSLKVALTQAPILAYPDLQCDAAPFVVQTDASAEGLGAVLEQADHVIAYASRALTKAERNYSVIQRECLAIIYSLKQFRHYLLGRKFHLVTDHAPLQWLSAQKMEGMLCRWVLAMQEFDFDIKYRRGSLNLNADALSRRSDPGPSDTTAVTISTSFTDQLRQHQKQDPLTRRLFQALETSKSCPKDKQWKQSPLHRYAQLWSQLLIVDGVVCRRYAPDPVTATVTVPVLPLSLQPMALQRCHDEPSAGHLGFEKTLHKLQQEAYWVYMAKAVEEHCRQCVKCNRSKPPAPVRAPMTSVPIGKPWQMIAIDILEVPLSYNNN